MSLTLTSPAFTHADAIPARHSCDGEDISPALDWMGIPQGTESLVLIMDDPDAPDPEAPKMTWVHWVLYNLPPDLEGLPEGADPLPAGTASGLNNWNRHGYGGPCPPIGRHRYFFKLYALDTRLGDLDSPSKAEVESAMQGHILAQTEMIGTFER